MGNSLGKLFSITSFGESHGRCVGIIIDGCPAGLLITEEEIQKEIARIAAEINAKTKEDFPKLMPAVMKELKGKADGKIVKQEVEKYLGKA